MLPLLKKSGLKIILEPGRFIVGNAGILLTRVLYVKKSGMKNFAVVDAGMNDLIRPALYQAYHEILPVVLEKSAPMETYDIVGPICESGDFLGKERCFPTLRSGDILAVMSAGAYAFSMSSNYNARRRAAEAMVNGNRVILVRRRESYRDLI
jgi:diaminopimelate decarboxylase